MNGFRDSTTPKQFHSPFLQNQFCILKNNPSYDLSSDATFFKGPKVSTIVRKKKKNSKTNILKSNFNRWTSPSKPTKYHKSTSLSRSLGHALADTNQGMPNMSSEVLQCCYSSSSSSSSWCYLQALGKIATRRRYRPPFTNLTVLCKLYCLFLPGSPKTHLDMSK